MCYAWVMDWVDGMEITRNQIQATRSLYWDSIVAILQNLLDYHDWSLCSLL